MLVHLLHVAAVLLEAVSTPLLCQCNHESLHAPTRGHSATTSSLDILLQAPNAHGVWQDGKRLIASLRQLGEAAMSCRTLHSRCSANAAGTALVS